MALLFPHCGVPAGYAVLVDRVVVDSAAGIIVVVSPLNCCYSIAEME